MKLVSPDMEYCFKFKDLIPGFFKDRGNPGLVLAIRIRIRAKK